MEQQREKYIVVLEVEIPKAGSVVDRDGSTQNAPDKWIWNKMLEDGRDYDIKHLLSVKK